MRIFDQRAQRRVRLGRARLAGLGFQDKVVELARILDEDGYLAEWERVDDDTFVVQEFNCPVQEVVHRYRQECANEMELIRTLLPEADVLREDYIMNGAAACSYRITRRRT